MFPGQYVLLTDLAVRPDPPNRSCPTRQLQLGSDKERRSPIPVRLRDVYGDATPRSHSSRVRSHAHLCKSATPHHPVRHSPMMSPLERHRTSRLIRSDSSLSATTRKEQILSKTHRHGPKSSPLCRSVNGPMIQRIDANSSTSLKVRSSLDNKSPDARGWGGGGGFLRFSLCQQ